ncbi:DUF262 domain-containing protein [Commensalibacter oyaizuii]|uniref:DUF262 domain-containing HNH endonuclease family protein n=1 Tax=Commensalibacter oyaizuii TaxID=3043873 RepID=A0ABT6PZ47_9PROT|nr:DUF262 domain-containing HNH endonuclease family protein [Commensalibacter sp. TBRC 16381]MDI2090127.1 DUF262 domain-containing HNH endonuclease family protein [Commensalibacter sp. TBRC 16381]
MSVTSIDSRLIGVGALLKQQRLAVPSYQRSYKWELQQVKELYQDIIDAKNKKSEQYFLGTVVITKSEHDNIKNIIDGQQRIVTASILISAIRNYFAKKKDTDSVETITRDYISSKDLRTKNEISHVLILPDDQKFYTEYVIKIKHIGQKAPKNLSDTQKRLFHAIKQAQETIAKITDKDLTKTPDDDLFDLIEFIEKKTVLVSLDVGDEANAYVIFEVLNDRGLDLTVADLLKNYVFGAAGKEKLSECQAQWNKMNTLISNSHGEGDVKKFIRHDWISRNGLIRERDLYDEIKRTITNETSVSNYITNLSNNSEIYAAFLNLDSSLWKDYNDKVKQALYLFNIAKITQVRPLLMSVFNNFNKKEINKTIPMLASWSVRFLICGEGGSGELEKNYAQKAKEISNKTITTALELFDSFKILPTDIRFENSFATVNAKGILARWCLSELEIEKNGNQQKIANPDTNEVNLEHVFPEKSGDSWEKASKDISKYLHRLGNLALLKAKDNSLVGNCSFADKKKVYSKSDFLLTKEIASCSSWDVNEINNRQKELAKLAVRRWKNKP